MTPEEIKRLREEIHYGCIVTPFSSLTKCLDTIEAQAKTLKNVCRLRAELIILSGNYCYCVTTGKCHYCKLRECLARWEGK